MCRTPSVRRSWGDAVIIAPGLPRSCGRSETYPRRAERPDVKVRRFPVAPLRLSPVIRHTSRAECSDDTFVQLCLIRAHDEEARFTRLSQVARPVPRLKLSGFVRT